MAIQQISVGFTFTKNLGNYESIKVDAGVVVAVGEGEDPEEVAAKAWSSVKGQVIKGLQAWGAGVK